MHIEKIKDNLIQTVMKKIANSRIVIIFALIIIAMLIRLLPHPNNFTPIAAIALFSGALLGENGMLLLYLW